jgi:hypothetical protein
MTTAREKHYRQLQGRRGQVKKQRRLEAEYREYADAMRAFVRVGQVWKQRTKLKLCRVAGVSRGYAGMASEPSPTAWPGRVSMNRLDRFYGRQRGWFLVAHAHEREKAEHVQACSAQLARVMVYAPSALTLAGWSPSERDLCIEWAWHQVLRDSGHPLSRKEKPNVLRTWAELRTLVTGGSRE